MSSSGTSACMTARRCALRSCLNETDRVMGRRYRCTPFQCNRSHVSLTRPVPLLVRPTHIQAHLQAHELTLRHASDDPDKLTKALVEARVDLNPHQVDAALFAFRSPLSKGALLADEVGLGKTIEAGLLATQRWAEGRRRILVLCPASLRTQWRDELEDKFFLPSVILDGRALRDAGDGNPFDAQAEGAPRVVIASYHFAARQQERLMTVRWDLAILDEAHRLRNVYKGARIGESIKTALSTTPKVLLTATPLQNSLLELYGLVSLIDDEVFGDQQTFARKYARVGAETDRFDELKQRLEPLCHRTLRRQVVEYVSYTKREPLTQTFAPNEEEQVLYDLVSEYLRRESLVALPHAQRALITLVLRKLLASSTFAIAGALDTMVRRLRRTLADDEALRRSDAEIAEASLAEDLVEHELDANLLEEQVSEVADEAPEPLTENERQALASEIADLEAFRDRAVAITENAKGDALLKALATAFDRARRLGVERKAVIFTESRRTQEYLVGLLTDHGYADKIVRFSGTNSDPHARRIYDEWRQAHAGSDRVTGSRAIDMRAALVDAFRSDAEIMIATEAAAEGINLQFCSIVVNYDLPWNPQRVEQRIGRCHRYGQRNDVLVVNFLNTENAADQRVHELLAEKFKLFEGVFGASDEVLGAIDSGVDIERRIGEIYQRCRTRQEVDRDFAQLRMDFSDEIDTQMKRTRTKLLEHFDAEVHDRLKVRLEQGRSGVSRHHDLLLGVMLFALDGNAAIDPGDAPTLRVAAMPDDVDLPAPRRYTVAREADNDDVYLRPADPLVQWSLQRALAPPDGAVHLDLDYTGWGVKALALEDLVGESGVLRAVKLTISGAEEEEHLLLAAVTDDGRALTDDQVARLVSVPAEERPLEHRSTGEVLDGLFEFLEATHLATFRERRATWLGAEYDKLDRWAADERARARADVADLEREAKEKTRAMRQAGSEQERLELRRAKLRLDGQIDAARREYDQAASLVDARREAMLDNIERTLESRHSTEILFTVPWTLR